MGRKKPHHRKPTLPAQEHAPPTQRERLRQLLLEQVERLAGANPGWDGELVRDLLEVNELVVGLEILAEQMFECGAPYDPAFSVILDAARALGVGEATLEIFVTLAARFTTLGLVMGHQEGGEYQQERYYRDFLINGVALADRLPGQIPVFDWLPVDVQRATLDQLSGRVAGEMDGGRVPLCVCSACGDLGCGAVSMRVEVLEDAVIWREFGHQNNFQEGFRAMDDLGPFRFERANYFAVLGELRAGLGRPQR